MPQESSQPTFLAGWRSGDQADAQQATARQQRSYLEQVLANTRATKQEDAAQQARAAEFVGAPDDDPEILKFADRMDPVTNRPVYKTGAVYQAAQGRAATERTRRETRAGDQTLARTTRALFPNGIGTGEGQMDPRIDRDLQLLESSHMGPANDTARANLQKLAEYRSAEDRKVHEAERKTKLAKAESDEWTAKHMDIDTKSLPLVSQYLQTYGDGVTLRTLDTDNPAHRQLKIDAMVWARQQMQADDPARATLTETIRHHKATEARQERELRHKESTDRQGVKLTDESSLRKEFLAQSKDFVTISDSYGRLRAAASNPSAAGDLAMIFNYMKILDPGSVVRESEFATAQNSAGVPERVRAQYNRALRGERLSEVTRADFFHQAGGQYGAQLARQKHMETQFRKLAERAGMDPNQIVPDLVLPDHSPAPDQTPTSTTPIKPSSGWGTVQRIK